MRLTTMIVAATGTIVTALAPGQAAAEAKTYAYHASANYCPAGLQPITISGVICCGTPNQSMSYSQVKAHPVKRHRVKKHYVRSAKAHCPEGTKGCTYD